MLAIATTGNAVLHYACNCLRSFVASHKMTIYDCVSLFRCATGTSSLDAGTNVSFTLMIEVREGKGL